MEFRIRIRKPYLLALLAFILSTGYKTYDDLFEFSKNLEIFSAAYKEAGKNFVDEVPPGTLMRKGLDAMLASMDPYTVYYSESQTEEAMIERQGEYGGVGCRVVIREKYPVVTEIFKGYAFHIADIRKGDILKTISGQDMLGKTVAEVGTFLRGAPNTSLSLTIERNGEKLPKTVTRVSVRTKAVPWFGMVNANTGYVKLDEFSLNCSQEIENAILALKKDNAGMKQLILDLRGNGGGLLHEAVNIVSLFVGPGKLVVNMKGRTRESNRDWTTQKPAVLPDMPLVVLVDAQSASASEVVSGSLQDMDRAVIVGRNSFGKGLVQNFFQLPYRTQMKITTAKYYTPSGRCIQLLDYSKRNADGSAGTVPDSLRKAFKTNSGRTVYDGGGIRPDFTVDMFGGEPLLKHILDENLLFDFGNAYRIKNDKLPENNLISDAEVDQFINDCAGKLKISLRRKIEESLNKSVPDKDLIKTIMASISDAQLESELKAHIIHFKKALTYRMGEEVLSRYDDENRIHKHMFSGDNDIAKALEILNNTEQYQKVLKP
jgi:carboxyl-terminal processing protease